MDWRIYALLAMMFGALSPFFGSKAVNIHGQKTHYIITTLVFVCVAVYFLLTNDDGFSRVTKISFFCAILSGILGTTAFLLVSHTWMIVPNKLPLIMIILSFAATLNAITGHFMGNRLGWHQWVGVMGTSLCIVLANWKA